jgi:hypothetical protein
MKNINIERLKNMIIFQDLPGQVLDQVLHWDTEGLLLSSHPVITLTKWG